MPLPSVEEFGFSPLAGATNHRGEQLAWRKELASGPIVFRLLRTLDELRPTEAIQRDVMGANDIDITGATELIMVHETGGDLIGALQLVDGAEKLVGLSVGWGGYFNFRPVFVSDLLAVRQEVRFAGIGVELKKLQAALAYSRGFGEITWTVDPLRAPNARLNFEKLGAVTNCYEENRYGETYAAGLYGGIPADRLHISWRLDDPTLGERLSGRIPAHTIADLAGVPEFDPADPGVERAYVLLPSNIDQLIAADWDAALAWRMTLRSALPAAFAAGLWITGFVANVDAARGVSAFLLNRIEDGRRE